MADFVARHGLDHLDHLVDDDGAIWAEFGVTTQPAWVFVNDDGSTRTLVGALGGDGLRDEMDALAAS